MGNKGLYIPPEILHDNQLGTPQKMVFAVMVAAADWGGMVRLTSEEIAQRTGMTRGAAYANRVILRRLGYIEHIDRTTVNFRILKWPGGEGDGGVYLSQRPGIRRELRIHTNRNESSDRDGSHHAATDSREHGADGDGHDEDCPGEYGGTAKEKPGSPSCGSNSSGPGTEVNEDNDMVIIPYGIGTVKEDFMKKVILNELLIENFKGITKLELIMDGADCVIYGDNATGKSSVCDAWHWLLFGKNQRGETAFSIKPLDMDGNVRDSGAVTSVAAQITVDGTLYELQRTYYEKWSQKRGSAEKTFDGNTSDFYIDGIPMKKGEYESRIRELIADEDVFTLITGLYAFNEGLNMQSRRKVLYEMCGVRSDTELIAGEEKFAPLAGVLGKYTIEEYKKKLVSERRTLNAEKLKIPARIDECVKIAAGLRETDFDALGAELVGLEAERDGLNGELVRIKNDSAVQVKESELAAVRGEADNLERRNRLHRQSQANMSDTAKVNAWKLRLSAAETEERMLVGQISGAEVRAERLERQLEEKRVLWRQISDEPFTAPPACPTCGRAFDGDSLRAAENEFAQRKAERLGEITAQAKWMKDDLAEVRAELDEFRESVEKVKAELADIRASEPVVQEVIITDLPGYDDERRRLTERITALEAEIAELKNGTAHTRTLLTQKLTDIRREIDRVNGELAKKAVLTSTEERIEELRQAERTLTGQLGDNDRMQYLCEEFVRYKVSFIEDSVNSKFRMAKFKLFDVQVNGALVDCCEATYNGVPYAAVNHGTAVNLGLDIVETLSDYYGVTAPLFIDNAESVTRLLPSDTQVIRLTVSEKDKELRLEHENGGEENELKAAS